jgi:hypothetical protein
MDPSTYTKSNFAANSLARKDGIAPKYFGAIFFLKKINRTYSQDNILHFAYTIRVIVNTPIVLPKNNLLKLVPFFYSIYFLYKCKIRKCVLQATRFDLMERNLNDMIDILNSIINLIIKKSDLTERVIFNINICNTFSTSVYNVLDLSPVPYSLNNYEWIFN